jgi:hypothetical protein
VVEHRVVGGAEDAVLGVSGAVDAAWGEGAVEGAGEELSGDATAVSQDLHDSGGQRPVVLELEGIALWVEEFRLGVVAEEQGLETGQEGWVRGSGVQLVLQFKIGKALPCEV